jgi:hypothetical protein
MTLTEDFEEELSASLGERYIAKFIDRNMMATRDGDLVLACSGVDRIAFVKVK